MHLRAKTGKPSLRTSASTTCNPDTALASNAGEKLMNDLPHQGLLSIARQSGMAEPARCGVTINLLITSRAVRNGMQRIMRPLGLSEARFNALVTLYVLDPVPVSPANLAHHAAITRTAMTDTLDQLEMNGWISRVRQKTDRRVIHIHLTDQGRVITGAAIRRFLEAAEDFSETLNPGQQASFSTVCRILHQRAEAVVTRL
jgi:DNA-binding MarR family transcriptional regulator